MPSGVGTYHKMHDKLALVSAVMESLTVRYRQSSGTIPPLWQRWMQLWALGHTKVPELGGLK